MMLSKNFDLEEFCQSPTAKRLGIENVPDADQIANLRNLVTQVLEPLRTLLGKPIKVDSGFRCAELNTAVGGVKDSQHSRGEAADIQVKGMTPEEVTLKLMALELPFDEAISEHDLTENTHWTHVSYTTRRKNRAIVKRAIRENGTTTYFPNEIFRPEPPKVA
jgi:hypothetical protein